MPELKFNFRDLVDLDNDLEASKRAIPVIVQKILAQELRPLRNELRALIPRQTGRLWRSFGFSVKRRAAIIMATFGFMLSKRVSASAAIAGNVLQAGGARPRKGTYLWIPLPTNRAADGAAIQSPRELLSSGGFIQTSKAGNRMAFNSAGDPAFILKKFVKIGTPIPIEARVIRQLPEITGEIEQGISQVIEAKRAAEKII